MTACDARAAARLRTKERVLRGERMRAREEGQDGRSGGGAVDTCTGGEGEALWPLRGSRMRLWAGFPPLYLTHLTRPRREHRQSGSRGAQAGLCAWMMIC